MGATMKGERELYQRDRSIHPPAFTPSYKTSVLRSPRQALHLQTRRLRQTQRHARPARDIMIVEDVNILT